MIHAWNALNKHLGRSRKQALSVEEYVAARLSMVLEETGPAILISAMTNILADAVGSFTGSPEITLLCIANMGAIVVDFFYQISLFTSVMALCAIYEERSLRKKSEKSVPA
uniref:SSD domain-containing protein n=1 Tax=Ditylenchus dipsaci TaxID=166011 RepID=A0A915EAY8_9BILA